MCNTIRKENESIRIITYNDTNRELILIKSLIRYKKYFVKETHKWQVT